MNLGLLIMTALVPTAGHQYLVQFASNFIQSSDEHGELDVIIFDRKAEPILGYKRKQAFEQQFATSKNINFYVVRDDDAPQNDDGTQEFWDYWVNMVYEATQSRRYDYVFASEAYGKTFADQYEAEFIPCDIDREVIPVKGTNVRHDIKGNWQNIMPSFRQHLTKQITFFGAESTGKTTMAKHFAKSPNYGGLFLHEWARPYLERFGSEVTDVKMDNITNAQFAAQKAVLTNPACGPVVYQDTDLLSTIGYYRIYSGVSSFAIEHRFQETRSHLYILMNSKIPFTPDPLRYGGDQRESTDEFWIDLLEEFNCNYYVVQATDPAEQIVEIEKAIDDFFHKAWYEVASFIRD